MRIPRFFTRGLRGPYDGLLFESPANDPREGFNCLVGSWTHFAEKHGYFTEKEDAAHFYDEVRYMLIRQMATPRDSNGKAASLNLLKFVDPETQSIDFESYNHASRVWTMVLEISRLKNQAVIGANPPEYRAPFSKPVLVSQFDGLLNQRAQT